jgi:hypothetical protein
MRDEKVWWLVVGWISAAQSTFRDHLLMVDFASLIHPTIHQFSLFKTLVFQPNWIDDLSSPPF